MIGLSFLRNYQTALTGLDSLSNTNLTNKFAHSFCSIEYERSKWLVNTLAGQKQRFENVAILGSSFSTYLVPMLCTRMAQINSIVLYDKDPQKIDVARMIHHQIRTDVNINFCLMDVQASAQQISDSLYDLLIVPYAESVSDITNIRTKINKALYVIQGEVGDAVKDEKDLMVASGCIQQSFRGVERMAGKTVAMIVGSKRV